MAVITLSAAWFIEVRLLELCCFLPFKKKNMAADYLRNPASKLLKKVLALFA